MLLVEPFIVVFKMSDFGWVHSIESFSTLDGPGVRVVVFLQGCFLNCIYCHNPDTWRQEVGKKVHFIDLFNKIQEYGKYIRNGGVTLSGGEPLLQSGFSSNFLNCCKKNGFHTAIETAGSVDLEHAEIVLEKTDLLILDLKGLDKVDCKQICKIDIEKTIKILNYCELKEKPIWIRHVLVPKYTLNYDKLKKIAKFLKKFRNIQRVELLPFHKMGEYKWKELNLFYTLKTTKPPTREELQICSKIFEEEGLTTY